MVDEDDPRVLRAMTVIESWRNVKGLTSLGIAVKVVEALDELAEHEYDDPDEPCHGGVRS
ncbi:MAG: hypothetical protein KGL39_32165 [Patescibacteria group bacterium]|nr:hypothetical protein [Patescibacteria group bacterium]